MPLSIKKQGDAHWFFSTDGQYWSVYYTPGKTTQINEGHGQTNLFTDRRSAFEKEGFRLHN